MQKISIIEWQEDVHRRGMDDDQIKSLSHGIRMGRLFAVKDGDGQIGLLASDHDIARPDSCYEFNVFKVRKILEGANIAGRVVIDIGAHRGLYTQLLETLKPSRILAIEPHPENVKVLREVISSVVEIVQGVVSEIDGERKLYTTMHGTTSHSISEGVVQDGKHWQWDHDVYRYLMVPSYRLDTLAANLDVAFIKIDVEGAEIEVIRSGIETLRRCLPCLDLEVHHSVDLPELRNLLDVLGYDVPEAFHMPDHPLTSHYYLVPKKNPGI